MEIYNQEQPLELDVENLSKIPIFMFSAKYDKIVNYEENIKWSQKIKGVKSHEILDGDHLSFLCGKDMAFMDQILQILKN